MSLCLSYAYLCSKKDMNKIILSVFALLLYSCGTTKTNIVTRENLLYLHLNEKHTLSNIVVERIVIPKGGKADYHLHPCPVFGYVVSGNLLFQIDGQASQYMKAGEETYSTNPRINLLLILIMPLLQMNSYLLRIIYLLTMRRK